MMKSEVRIEIKNGNKYRENLITVIKDDDKKGENRKTWKRKRKQE